MQKAILLNGVELTLLSRGQEFLGLGTVRVGRTPLRSGQRPMFVEIRNPSAVWLCHYRPEGEKARDGGLDLAFSPDAIASISLMRHG